MSKRRKHSAMKRDHKLYGRSRIWTWESDRDPKTGNQISYAEAKTPFGWCALSHDLARHLIDYPRNWLICVRLLWIDSAGTIYMDQADFELPSRRINDVEGVYLDLRAELMEKRRTDQIFDIGWIAQTWTGTNSDEEWFYHDTPPGIAPTKKMEGEDYSEERHKRWQEII